MPYADPQRHRECNRRAQSRYYQRNRQRYADYATGRRRHIAQELWRYKLQHPCQCGECHPCCLVFHHRNRSQKILEVADMVRLGYGLARIWAEVRKCDVVCMNCHMKLHHRRRSSPLDGSSLDSNQDSRGL